MGEPLAVFEPETAQLLLPFTSPPTCAPLTIGASVGRPTPSPRRRGEEFVSGLESNSFFVVLARWPPRLRVSFGGQALGEGLSTVAWAKVEVAGGELTWTSPSGTANGTLSSCMGLNFQFPGLSTTGSPTCSLSGYRRSTVSLPNSLSALVISRSFSLLFNVLAIATWSNAYFRLVHGSGA